MAQHTKLTTHRAAVKAKVSALRATRQSPAYLAGAEFRAALWLYEHGHLGKVGRAFYPL
jgi:hypothetical protein